MVFPQKTTYVDAVALDGGEVEVPPKVLEMVHPAYPGAGAREAAQAFAIVQFEIDRRGRVGAATVQSASGEELEDPALAAIREWRFTAATRAGRPIPVRATVRLSFDPGAG